MKKIKTIAALTAVIALAFSTVASAAPSPVAGIVTVVVPGTAAGTVAQIKAPTEKEMKALADFISANALTAGTTPNVKGVIDIEPPAGYKGGNVPIVFAAAGLKNGAQNVFAYIRLKNGKIVIAPCTVRGGYVGFYAPAFGTVAIVELTPTLAKPASATLH